MLENNNNENRNLSDVFRELQEMQNPNSDNFKKTTYTITKSFKLSNVLIICTVLILGAIAFFPRDLSFGESYAKEEEAEEEVVELQPIAFEINRKALNIQKIISENSNFEKVQEQVVEEREIEFEINSTSNSLLPEGEQQIMQEGVNGKEKVSLVKTYENGEFIEEVILNKERTLDPVPEIIDIGTSKFLAKLKIHIGDTLYLTSTSMLKKENNNDSEDIAEIKQNLDVKLLDLPNEEWCKVSFDDLEGYLPTSTLTSAYATPNVVEKNRIQRILIKVNEGMQLNKSSGLKLSDFKKIFTGLTKDTNNIFEDNYEVFYNVDKKYNINGIFLASIAIHESAWGTSQISKDKKNLFGYGAYDSTPYESSYTFDTYAEGIETVARVLVKYYLNPSGAKIYDGETAEAWYYNGSTLSGVNVRYASDENWHTKVFSYMEMLYNRL